MIDSTEALIKLVVQWLKLGVESTGALIIALGTLVAIYHFLRALLSRETASFTAIRLILARYLALALEFQLGADILSTAITPDWTSIKQLGAIAVIRTGLNYFLSLEMKEEQATSQGEASLQTRNESPEDVSRKERRVI